MIRVWRAVSRYFRAFFGVSSPSGESLQGPVWRPDGDTCGTSGSPISVRLHEPHVDAVIQVRLDTPPGVSRLAHLLLEGTFDRHV